MYVLDPSTHGTYFDEIRSLVSPDHSLTADMMSNVFIRQWSYLGKAETAVIRSANTTVAALKPTGDDASAVPATDADKRKRELVWVIQALTALDLLEPQILSETELSDNVRYEEWSIEERKKELSEEISKILPEVLTPATPTGSDGSGVVSVSVIEGTF